MAIYYIDGTAGNDANAGTTPATAWQTATKALASGAGSASSFNTWIILSDTTVDYNAIGSRSIYAHVASDGATQRKIQASNVTGLANGTWRHFGSMSNIHYERVDTDGNGGVFSFYGNANDCIFEEKGVASSVSRMTFNGVCNDCTFKTGPSGNMFLDDSENNTYFNKCTFEQVRFDTSLYLAQDNMSIGFNGCIFNSCSNVNDASALFSTSREISWSFQNCSTKLVLNQNLIKPGTMTGTTNPYLHVDNCIIEGTSGGTNYIIETNADYDNYISLLNTIMFDCLTHNPIYTIQVSNITTSGATNFKSTTDGNPDYFELSNSSPARAYTSNLDAGAVQAAPLVLFPAVGDVRSGIPFGNGESGDQTGTYVPADQADVLSGETYGAGGVEYTGSYLPSPPPNNFDLREGVTVGAVTGILRVPSISTVEDGVEFDRTDTPLTGTMTPLAPQQGPFSVTVYTSDGSNISVGTPSATTTVEVESGVLIDTILSDLGASETVANIDTIRNASFPNRLDIRINR